MYLYINLKLNEWQGSITGQPTQLSLRCECMRRIRCGVFCVLIGYPSGQDGAILPAQDCLSCYRNKISPKSKRVHESFLSQHIFRASTNIFCDFSVGIELKNEKSKIVNKNDNEENKNVSEFQEYILLQKPAKTKVK